MADQPPRNPSTGVRPEARPARYRRCRRRRSSAPRSARVHGAGKAKRRIRRIPGGPGQTGDDQHQLGPDILALLRFDGIVTQVRQSGMIAPRTGMEVAVAFLEGNPGKPPVTGHKARSTFRTNRPDGKERGAASMNSALRIRRVKGKHSFTQKRIAMKRWVGNDRAGLVGGRRPEVVGASKSTMTGGTEAAISTVPMSRRSVWRHHDLAQRPTHRHRDREVVAGDSLVLRCGKAEIRQTGDGRIRLADTKAAASPRARHHLPDTRDKIPFAGIGLASGQTLVGYRQQMERTHAGWAMPCRYRPRGRPATGSGRTCRPGRPRESITGHGPCAGRPGILPFAKGRAPIRRDADDGRRLRRRSRPSSAQGRPCRSTIR
ncbi:hypothetical protein [Paracoccus binzhouensis]|nr:hypothetical protein [Paracoccus binzhouensis]